MGMLKQVSGSSTPGDLMKMVSGGGSTQMLSSLFGQGTSAVGATIDRALGFKASPLLAMAAPFVISQLSQRVSAGGLDKPAVAKLLQDEQKTLTSAGGDAVGIVQQALSAGREAASTRGRYSNDQWNTIRLGPVAAASLVIGASPSGAIGITKEVAAMGDVIAALKKTSSPASLFSLATAEPVTAADLTSLPTDRTALIGLLRNSVATVRATSPIEGAAYGQFIIELATKVAEASKEGGFLGIGGTRINEAEQAALDEIKAAVG